jgi:hypothetical protein
VKALLTLFTLNSATGMRDQFFETLISSEMSEFNSGSPDFYLECLDLVMAFQFGLKSAIRLKSFRIVVVQGFSCL